MIRTSKAGARRTTRIAGIATAAAVLLASCGQPAGDQPKNQEPGTAETHENPFAHVHGLAVDPETEQLLLATHNGLFQVSPESTEKVGPTLDLMGFAAAGEGRYYASGHPSPGSELPNPMGLIESTDGGQTWQELSRQGESDFHAMTVSEKGVIGFDGKLRLSADGEDWTESDAAVQPANLAASLNSPVVLATTGDGVQRSDDGGLTWTLPASAPVLLLTAFADAETAVGVSPEGVVQVSRDAGKTWKKAGGTTGQPAAIAASTDSGGNVRIWVATEQGIEFSDDGGASFSTTVQTGERSL